VNVLVVDLVILDVTMRVLAMVGFPVATTVLVLVMVLVLVGLAAVFVTTLAEAHRQADLYALLLPHTDA
jgi:hypothetical protein